MRNNSVLDFLRIDPLSLKEIRIMLERYCEIVEYWHDWIFDEELKDRALEREIT